MIGTYEDDRVVLTPAATRLPTKRRSLRDGLLASLPPPPPRIEGDSSTLRPPSAARIHVSEVGSGEMRRGEPYSACDIQAKSEGQGQVAGERRQHRWTPRKSTSWKYKRTVGIIFAAASGRPHRPMLRVPRQREGGRVTEGEGRWYMGRAWGRVCARATEGRARRRKYPHTFKCDAMSAARVRFVRGPPSPPRGDIISGTNSSATVSTR